MTLRTLGRVVLAVALAVLGLFHLFFSWANLKFIEDFVGDIVVVLEFAAAFVAALALWWASWRQLKGDGWASIALVGAIVFTLGMIVSIATETSTPSMIQVVVPIWLAWVIGVIREKRVAAAATS